MANSVIAALMVRLGLDSAQFQTGVAKSRAQLAGLTSSAGPATRALSQLSGIGRSFALGLAGGLVTAAFAGITSNVRGLIADLGDLKDAADRMGLSAENLQGLQAGFKLGGVDLDASTQALEIFTQRIGEAASGEGQLYAALRKSGVALRDGNGDVRSTIDLLRDFASVLEAAPSDAERLALAVDAFGKSGRPLVNALSGGSAAIDEMMSKAREAGLVLDEALVQRAADLDDKFDILTMRIGNFWKTMSVGAAGWAESIGTIGDLDAGTAKAMAEFEKGLLQSLDAESALTALREEAGLLAMDLGAVATELNRVGNTEAHRQFRALADELLRMEAMLQEGTLSTEGFMFALDSLGLQAGAAIEELGAIDGVSFGNVIDRLGGISGALASAIKFANILRGVLPGDGGSRAPVVSHAGRAEATAVDGGPQTSPRPPKVPDMDFDLPDIAGTGGGGGGGGRAAQIDEFAKAVAKTREETGALLDQMSGLTGATDAYGASTDYAAKRAELLAAAQKSGTEITPELTAQIDELARAYAGAGDKLADMQEGLAQIEEAGRATFVGLATGTKTWSDALSDLLSRLADQLANSVFDDLWSGISGKGGLGGVLGNLLGGLFGGGANPATGTLGLPHFASGKRNFRGGPAMINERGGELVVLPGGSTVVPHDLSAGLVGGEASLSQGLAMLGRMFGAQVQAVQGLAFQMNRGQDIGPGTGPIEVHQRFDLTMNGGTEDQASALLGKLRPAMETLARETYANIERRKFR